MMSLDEDDQLREALERSMVTYSNEQNNSTSEFADVFEDFFSELQDETFEQEEKNPRGFQQELIDIILKDHHNYIVFAPTGCGKTFIASMVAKHYLEMRQSQNLKATVVFVVDRIPLVLQQAKALKEDLGGMWNIEQYCGELGAIDNWELAIRSADVLVCIAQTLLNCVAANPGALSQVDLLIFDECHHTTKDHPYHKIIKDHWKILPPNSRPKILGLTASPGGKADINQTRVKIQALCENMHSKIIMVQDNIEELKGTLNPPEVKLVPIVLDRYLLDLVTQITLLIKKMEVNSKSPYKWPDQKTSFEYMRFCEQLGRKPGISRNIRSTCGLNLLLANCIQLLEDVGLECVIEYLQTQKREGAWLDEIGILQNQFKARLRPGLTHGKRDTLMRTLNEIQNKPGFQRGIVFVKTRASAHALHKTIMQHLRFRPCILVGHGAKGEGGMKAKSQQTVVKDFNSGASNLMIATSVAEEGLDIQACNTVIRYDALDTAEALIQSRGRARFRNSTFVVMLNGGDSKKFYEALEAEKNMHAVVSEIQRKPGNFYDFLHRTGTQSSPYTTNAEDFGFEIVNPPARNTTTSTSSLVPYESNNRTENNNSQSQVTDLVTKYTDTCGVVPRYMIKSTGRGYLGEAFVDMMLEDLPHSFTTKEVYGATAAEVKILLNTEIIRELYNLGELEKIVDDVSKLQLSPAPRSTSIVSAPPLTSTPPRISPVPYNPSPYSGLTYPGNHYTTSSPSPYPATSSSLSRPSPTSIPSRISSTPTYTPSTPTYTSSTPAHTSYARTTPPQYQYNLPPAPSTSQVQRVDNYLKSKQKTAISYLFEWCQMTKKPLPVKICSDIAPFACTITIEQLIKYKGPPCSSKKDAEHEAAKHVLVLLKVL